jgi:type IV pilus assembly protein PilN
MPRINLLPWRDLDRKRKRQEFGLACGAAVLVGLLVAGVWRLQYGTMIDNQAQRNQYLKEQIADVDKQIEEILGLEEQKRSLQERIQVIEQLQSSRPEAVHLMDQMVRLLPDGVYLTSIKQTDKKIQIKGIAESSTRVSALMRNIDGSEWLKDPSLEIVETTKGSGDGGSSFTLYASQVSKVVEPNGAKQSPAAKTNKKGAA